MAISLTSLRTADGGNSLLILSTFVCEQSPRRGYSLLLPKQPQEIGGQERRQECKSGVGCGSFVGLQKAQGFDVGNVYQDYPPHQQVLDSCKELQVITLDRCSSSDFILEHISGRSSPVAVLDRLLLIEGTPGEVKSSQWWNLCSLALALPFLLMKPDPKKNYLNVEMGVLSRSQEGVLPLYLALM